jgi:iron complex outermembrane receptor protein
MKQTFFCVLFMLSTFLGFAQRNTLSGKITNTAGEALIGASVVIKGTVNGTTTDLEGNFKLSGVGSNAVLLVSYVGYQPKEIVVAGQSSLTITLEEDTNLLTQVEIVGTRNQNRTVTETVVPVDVIDISMVTSRTGQLDINQLLQFAAPSFNANRQSGSDGADHVDPASLRGLGPDQTLVLINGKRRHQSSLVNLFGTRGRGNTGTDLNAIPAAAIERIEILRDGAAAQYGSDAIAGVINVVLKQNVNELNLNVNSGMHQAKYRFDNKAFDGFNYNMNANYGFSVGKGGYVNLTGDFNLRDHTNRANTHPDDLARREYGDPKIRNASLYLNSRFKAGENRSIYAFGGYNDRKGDAYAWTRFADSDRNIPSIYPNGFDPLISSKINDAAITVGMNDKWGKWDVDLYNSIGYNRFHYSVNNTLNASMGENSKTSFDAGGFSLFQQYFGVKFNRFFKDALQGMNIAWGSEFRNEQYSIFAGEEASWQNYNPDKASGSQGFPGFRPTDVIKKGRSNLGIFLDAEADVTKSWILSGAVRFENYSDFGATLNGKLASRLKLANTFALRGSISTGFRAPSLAQIYFNSTFTNFVNGNPVDVLLARNGSAITQALGIPPLKEETSLNGSFGFTFTPASNFSLTVDGYYVKVNNRVVLTGQFSDEDPDIGAELQRLRVGLAQFFTNAIATTTTGLDVILAHSLPLGSGKLNTTLAANFNNLEINSVTTAPRLRGKEDTYFDLRERYFVKAAAPPSKINLTFDYSVNKWSTMLRFIRFGEVKLANWEYDENLLDIYQARLTTDLSLRYTPSNWLGITLGGQNIFNVYPNMSSPSLTESGGAWDPVQMGSNGAFYYLRMNFKIPTKK